MAATRIWWIGGAVAAAMFAALAVPAVRHLREAPPPPPPPIHLAFEPPPGAVMGSGDEPLDAAISADGRDVVFVATSGGTAHLWRRTLETGQTDRLAGTDGARQPAWKRTGGVVAFFAGGRLKALSLRTGAIADLASAPAPAGASWLPDGSLLFAPRTSGPIKRMLSGAVSDATRMAPGDRGHAFPAAAGDSGAFTYVAFREDGRRTIRLVTADGERDLADTAGHGQLAGGFLVHARDGVLLARRFDPETRMVSSRGTPVAPSVGVSPSGRGMYAASERLLLFSDGAAPPRDLVWFDVATGRSTMMAEPADYWQVRLSPDDRRAAVTLVDRLLRTLDVFVLPTAAAGDALPLSRSIAADTDPVWSPDGATVLFRSLQAGRPLLFTKEATMPGGSEERLMASADGDTATDWRAGALLVYNGGSGSRGADLSVLHLDDGRREPVAADAFNETDGRWSPDGRWVAYVSDESGEPDIYARRADGSGGRLRVSSAGGTRPRWDRDGRAIYFVRGARIMRADLAPGGARFEAAVPVMDAPGLRDFDVAHRSDRLAVLVPAPAAAEPSVRAVLDWPTGAGGQ